MNSAPPTSTPPPPGQSGQSGQPSGPSAGTSGSGAGSDSGPRVTRDQVRDLSRLRRAHQGRMVGGVAEGLSRHLDIDPLLIRVIFGALTVFGGAGIVLYVLAWLTIPDEDAYDSAASRALRQDPERTMSVGLALAGIAGAVTLLGAIGFATPRPFAVIVLSLVGLVLFTVFSRRSGQPPTVGGTPAGPVPPAGSAPPSSADSEADTTPAVDATADPAESVDSADSADSADDEVTGPLPDVEPTTPIPGAEATTPIPTDEAPTTTLPPYAPGAAASAAAASTQPRTRAWWQRSDSGATPPPGAPAPPAARPSGPPPRPPKPKSRLTPITLAVMALALGGIWFADAAGADVHPSVYPGTVLALTAVALLVGTWYGRAKLLIPVGFLAALLTAAAVVVGPGPYGERVYEPTSAASVKSSYEHGAGRLAVNLDGVSDVQALDGRTIKVESHVGLVQVIVPTSLDAQITSHVDAGDIEGPAVTHDEGDGDQRATMEARHDGRPLVTIDVDLTFGKIEILRLDCPQLAIAHAGDTREQDLSTLTWKGEDVRDPAACH